MSNMYKKIDDISRYVQELSEKGESIITAEKQARIAARKGDPGEWVISWSVDSEGRPVLEKRAQVSCDSKTGEIDWVVVKIDDTGEVIVDTNGNKNEWIMGDRTFRKKYEEDMNHPGIYKPVGGPQKFMKLTEPVTIQQWGQEMNVDKGGYINVTDPKDVYVISGRDFGDTYRIIKSE